MKKFRLAPLAIALVGALAILPSAQSEVPAAGDLDIYTSGNVGSGSAILLMIDTSSLGGIGQNERIEVMRQAIIKLMDNPNGFPAGTKVGVGMYPSTSMQNAFAQGDGLTGGIYIPISELTTEHRQKIKDFVNKIKFGVDEAPMASAYAEAGSYMLGTKTSKLTYAPKDAPPSDGDTVLSEAQKNILPKTRVLRHKGNRPNWNGGTWQFCPEEKRKMVYYDTKPEAEGVDTLYEYSRIECASDADWVDVYREIIAPQRWAGTNTDEPTKKELESIEGRRTYNLMWYYVGGSQDRPHGTFSEADNERISPKTLTPQKYSYRDDPFKNFNPTPQAPGGSTNEWTYMFDDSVDLESSLVPVLRQRVLRRKFDWSALKDRWQYCAFDKAELVDYIYSSYRLMCAEKDWLPIDKSNIVSVTGTMTWNGSWWFGGRPHEVDTRYLYDPILNPYDGFAYYYDKSFKSSSYPPLPPTLNFGYSTSGIRNSPPEVRGFQNYTYDQPNYNLCPAPDGKVQSNPGNRVSQSAAGSAAIYFLTAGEPRSAGLQPINEMNMSLSPARGNDIAVTNAAGPITSANCETSGLNNKFNGADNRMNAHWGCMGQYSKRLRDLDNPAKKEIKTAVFMITSNATKQVTNTENCTATKTTYKNACLLGDKNHGGGGFHETLAPPAFKNNPTAISQQADLMAEAMIAKTEELKTDNLGLIPTGLPVVPRNDFDLDAVHDFGYLPLMSPVPGSKVAQWTGNLRKYKQINGTYVDKSGNSPYTNTANSILADTTLDYWTSSSSAYKSNSPKGGAFENIPMPTSATTATPRNVYLSQATAGSLTKLSPDAAQIKQVTVAGISDNVTLRRLLLNYMGYTISNYTDQTTTAQIIDTFSSGANKSLGGVFHSTPILLTSKLELDGTTKQYVAKKRHILFGAMDNAVHIVDDSDGKEVMSYFPREVLANNGQYKAITPELSATGSEVSPAFGVDGPWTSYARFDKPDSATNYSTLVAKELYAYGGARLGAKAYYGLDLTGLNDTGFTPKQLFTITPTSNTKFKQLGYTWGQPVVTKIRWQGKPKQVVILTGGYDSYFDKTDDERKEEFKDAAKKTAFKDTGTSGNAIYIVDAKTGEPLIVASNKATNVGVSAASNSDNALVNDPKNTTAGSYNDKNATIPVLNSNLKYSVAGSVKVLDRDADELTDHVYFADLNGQVFRLDINNSSSKAPTSTTATDGKNPAARLVRLADLALNTSSAIGPRFYEAPVVTIQQDEVTGERFAVVSVASGDRSNPLWTPGDSAANNNYVFAIYDKDVAKVNLFNTSLTTLDVKANDLVTSPVSGTVSNFSQKGWKFPLDKFTITTKSNGIPAAGVTDSVQSKAIKALGPMSAVGSKLYIAAYNPNDGRSDTTSCSAEIKGSSEAMQFCLPYGYCDKTKTAENQYQRIKMGNGVLGIAFGGAGEGNKDRVLLTSNASVKVTDTAGNTTITPTTSPSLNGSGPAFKQSYQFKPTLRPMAWYDLQSQRYGTTTAPSTPTTGAGQ
jgi:hypothetical protein